MQDIADVAKKLTSIQSAEAEAKNEAEAEAKHAADQETARKRQKWLKDRTTDLEKDLKAAKDEKQKLMKQIELGTLAVKELRARAKAGGASAEALENAADSEDHRAVLVALVIEHEAAGMPAD